MDETVAPYEQQPAACPFVALEDDRDRRSDKPDYRHRCFASRQPEPRAFPHQERYCLARAFTECPIFLDWAQRESAAVVPSRRAQGAPLGAAAAAAAAAAANADTSDTVEDHDAGVPPFLAGRPRPQGRAAELEAPTAGDPEEGLWGPAEAERRRTAPAQAPVVGRARANIKHPDWEEAPRLESYPRIRSHRGMSGFRIPRFAGIAVLIAGAALLAFLVLPGILLPQGGGGARATSTPTAPPPTASPKPTPVPSPTSLQYTIQPGDAFDAIADKFGITPDELAAANPQVKNRDLIAAGETLTIPPPGSGPAPSSTASPAP